MDLNEEKEREDMDSRRDLFAAVAGTVSSFKKDYFINIYYYDRISIPVRRIHLRG